MLTWLFIDGYVLMTILWAFGGRERWKGLHFEGASNIVGLSRREAFNFSCDIVIRVLHSCRRRILIAVSRVGCL